MKTTLCMALLVILLGFLIAGCSTVEYRSVDVNPYTFPVTTAEKKISKSAALVLDNEFKNYTIKHELVGFFPGESATAAYQVGPHLERYARDVAADLFQLVTVFGSVTEATSKADIILVPRAVRSSTNITTPVQVMLIIEWQVMDRSGQNILWLTSVESQSTVKPAIFGHGKAKREAYTLVLSDLSIKTIEAFQNSPEIKSLSMQQR